MKINLKTLLIMVLLAIIVAIVGANLIQYSQTDTNKETKPLALQSSQTEVVEQATGTIVTAPVNLADSPVSTGGVAAVSLIPDPVNTVYDFYDYVKSHDCQKANSIRPNYSGCQEVDDVNHFSVKLLQSEGDRAAVQVGLAYTKKGKPETFDGYMWLKREANGHWQIQPDAIPKDKITANDFLQSKASIVPKAVADTPVPDSEKLEIKLDQITEQSTATQPAAPPITASETDGRSIGNRLEDNTPPPPPSGEQVDVTAFRSFGSEKILNACWTKSELRGSPADKKISSMKDDPDRTPPRRQYPHHKPKPLPANLQGSIRTVRIPDPNKKLVALTFDLCERASEMAGYDSAIVNYLRDNHIPATFYAGGKWMRSHPTQTKQLMADPLFEIGNHAWTHGNMRVLTGKEMQAQVLWTQAQYELLWDSLAENLQQCGVSPAEINKVPPIPLSFRYPYGTCSQESLDFMGNYGLPSIQWNIVTADPWRKQTADGIAKTIEQGIKPGSIIIAHANGRGWKTIDALPKFIPELINKGYKFVTVTQLLAEGKEVVNATDSCYEIKPGDNLHYDREVGKGTE